MPLLKLWNSIRGRSTGEDVREQAPAAESSAPQPSRRPGIALFGGGPSAGLGKLVRSVSARSVLEISVGDGSRAIEVLRALSKSSKSQHSLRYLAIDPFEAAPGGVSLKQFHQTLRAARIRPSLYPGSIDSGLTRIAHTVGMVDLVLISLDTQVWQTPRTLRLLQRVSHPRTTLLYCEEGVWLSYESAPSELRRAA